MALGDIGGVLKDLSIKVSFVRLSADKETRARELVRELSALFEEAAASNQKANHKPASS